MKITSLSLKNFKCFKKADIEFSKLTLLTGANSSGKSSLLNAILCNLQSKTFPNDLTLQGSYVNLGDFSDVIHRHDKGKTFATELLIDNSIKIKSEWAYNKDTHMPSLKIYEFVSDEITIKIHKKTKYISEIIYKPDLDKDTLIKDTAFHDFLSASIFKSEKQPKRIQKLFEIPNSEVKKRFLSSTISDAMSKLRHFNNIVVSSSITSALDIFQSLNEQTNYISSFRHHPERLYNMNYYPDLKVDKYGDKYIYQLYKWADENSNQHKKLIEHLKKIGIANDVQTKILPGGRFEVQVKTRTKGLLNSINDVGFGISQFLPIIVADLQLKKESTLILSQPEIHLHPDTQAQMSNYFVEQINTNKKRYVVETHSEYLINRVRLLIAKGELKSKDIKVYFIDNKKDVSKCHEITFEKSGKINGAPPEFFKTYMIDVMDIALNAEMD